MLYKEYWKLARTVAGTLCYTIHPEPYMCALFYIISNNFFLVTASTSQRLTPIVIDKIVMD